MVKLQELHIYFKLQMRYNQFNKEQFIQKAKAVHGDKYDYIFSNYVNMHTKVKIICPEHGLFEQSPSNHCKGVNCPNCAELQRVMVFKNNCKNNKQDFSHITPPKGSRIIPLTQGKYALVDEEDYERVNQYNWCLQVGKYAGMYIEKEHYLMHRFIMNVTDSKVWVDHIFHDTLDNRKSQLRVCTPSENSQNSRSNIGLSKYKGIHYHKKNNKWRACINTTNSRIHIGMFTNEEDAARAYDAKAKELFGEFAYLNFKN